ncbi:P-loop containing nucleoside triphosphate hydrolase protein [Piromyces finnis]|uniref:p-loop containing nucleoside triphosphate hydrolase protein n=1 Tax=Piromyces finnis TaxID=1754191 RepID=A0A1Y1V665_9FUNG|nr:P-loop containing nucleoside triphosphate hydrolase protein [Piromyces finnis]|eukprot:ORX47666.1 P-loop containing nucleoside triphosphate hydrolase protein [Piromyces finnis]
MSNNIVKCPICNKYVVISDINEHIDSNCQFKIVPMDDTLKDGINEKNKDNTFNLNSKNLCTNFPEKKKTVQVTLFSQLSNGKKSEDSLNKNISNYSESHFKSFSNHSNENIEDNNKSKNNINNLSCHSNKKIKIDEKTYSMKFDNNNYMDEKYRISPIKKNKKEQLPLAELARPKTLDDYFGQEELIGNDTILKDLIIKNKVPSLIFWGPPGVGKTCLVRIIAHQNNTFLKEISGTIHSLSDLKKASEECANHLKLTGKKAILFIDEIHRFNKLQQDSFLSWVEHGSYTLIGATTENPSFYLNSALLSRCRVFQLKKLSKNAIMSIIERAIKIKLDIYNLNLIIKNDSETKHITIDDNKTLNNIYIDKETLELLAVLSDGDARNSLNIVDMTLNYIISNESKNEITKDMIKMSFQKTQLLYDRDGEEHNNVISAFHDSIRGNDADAALYWLGRMIYAGEDPLYIARRLIRIASEDIGFGDNNALNLAISCYQTCQFIGMPECDVVLAQTSVYMARAKKSVEVFKALSMVKEVMEEEINYPVPMHLRNAPTELMRQLGYGVGNLYVPDYEEPVEQEYFPKELKCRRYLGVFEENRRKAYEKEKKRLEYEKKEEREKKSATIKKE